MGERLAQETPADVDVIIPVPDSGVPAALGFSQDGPLFNRHNKSAIWV